jgi:hypothetical protein
VIFAAPTRPVSRLRVLLGALALFGTLAGVIALSELLRHPPADIDAAIAPDAGDIRDEVVCPRVPPEEDPAPEALDGHRDAGPVVDVTSEDLYDCPAVYEGRLVRYEGEVVGALMHRGDGAWTQLNDDLYAGELGPLPTHRGYQGANAGVGVFLPSGLTEEVQTVGGPRARGDVLVVVGIFHRVDPDSREVAIIRADTVAIAGRGQPVDHAPLRDRQITGILLALAAAGLTTAHRIATRGSPLGELTSHGPRRSGASRTGDAG